MIQNYFEIYLKTNYIRDIQILDFKILSIAYNEEKL